MLFLISIVEAFHSSSRTTLSYSLLLLGVLLLYIGRPILSSPKALLMQKVRMFWVKRGAECCHRPTQALTIEHSFGLIRQCCAWEAERRSSAQAPLELFTATELPALRRQVPVRSLRRLRLLTSTYLLRDINARADLWANGGAIPRNIT